AVLIAFDRKERGRGELSAIQELQRDFGVPVISIATLDDLTIFIDADPALAVHAPAIAAYRATYGVQ
ncbi:MAG: orotate phosphoribosyltransferase, partial [Casimicrobiaceae bacterium]